MSIISQEKLARDFWQHNCPGKDGAVVYNEKGKSCPHCGATESAQTPTANTK